MKPKAKGKPVTYEDLQKTAVIYCEWNLCVYSCNKMEAFMEHIGLHTADISDEPNELGFSCIWRKCPFIGETRDRLVRHVLFHAFHSKIKGIGKVVVDSNQVECLLDDQSRNIIPYLPNCFECMWDDCDTKFMSVQNFFWHTQAHVLAEKSAPVHCRWRGCCKGIFKRKRMLKLHLPNHTHEKYFGCSNCGTIFHSKQMFLEHFQRQKEADSAFKCTFCNRKYPTETILKRHARAHINHFMCPQCEKTFHKKADVISHLKNRHSDSKPFKCPECPKRFKMRLAVVAHMKVHSADASYFCSVTNCSSKFRSHNGYTAHLRNVHNIGSQKSYVCHMCDVTVTKGENLTKHLKKVHNYQLPAGHCKFRYVKGEDGNYRLQEITYDSAELTDQLRRRVDRENKPPESDVSSESDGDAASEPESDAASESDSDAASESDSDAASESETTSESESGIRV